MPRRVSLPGAAELFRQTEESDGRVADYDPAGLDPANYDPADHDPANHDPVDDNPADRQTSRTEPEDSYHAVPQLDGDAGIPNQATSGIGAAETAPAGQDDRAFEVVPGAVGETEPVGSADNQNPRHGVETHAFDRAGHADPPHVRSSGDPPVTDATVDDDAAAVGKKTSARSRAPGGGSGRVKHDEKITVYISNDELLNLESARLTLRADHGMAVDRGRIVREALALVLGDLTDNGADSHLVYRLSRP